MTVFLYIWLVFLPLTAEVYSNRNIAGKYGCVFTPSVCVPPEDCNRITGHCQISSHATDPGYNEGDHDVMRVLEAVRSYDYTNPESHNLDTGFFVDADSIRATVESPRKSFSRVAKAFLSSDDSNNQVGRKQQDTNYGTRQLINRHLDEFQYALAQKGRKLADLTTDELGVLVRYLANVIRNEQSHSVDDSNPNELSERIPEGQLKNRDFKAQHRTSEDIDSLTLPVILESPEHRGNSESIEVVEDHGGDGIDMEVAESANTISSSSTSNPTARSQIQKETLYIVIIVVGATVLLIIIVTITSCAYYTYKKKRQEDIKFRKSMTSRQPVGSEYQDLCRQHYADKNYGVDDGSDSDASIQDYSPASTKLADYGPSKQERSKAHQATRNSSVSSVSWSEEPATASLDIATGHKVLDYMENHLDNKGRLAREWHDLCKNKPDEFAVEAAKSPQNISKNRIDAALPYDYNRVKLDVSENHVESDYINASIIIDSDPKRPLYIAAQGPLPSTVPDFWQMVWEHDCVAIVMLTALVEEGVNQCARYWPDEGSSRCHNFEINLVSEHIWCEHYLVRSLYLKHLGTGETRTVTQFHFLSWPKNGVPSTPKHLLELRRKVSKCSKAHHSPVLVHCSDGVARTGTYILLDLAINRLLKRPLEIDIAATLEHIRDMRAGMVANKDQFQFALTAVAEEVNAAMKTPN